MPRNLVHVPPALQQRLADMMHARVDAMVRMLDVAHHLLCAPSVGGRERLVPVGEDEAVWVGCRVLFHHRQLVNSSVRDGGWR